MKDTWAASATNVLAGGLAGLAGTLALVSMESFDKRYAPATVAGLEPVGEFALLARRPDPPPIRKRARRFLLRAGHGALGGALYAAAHGPAREAAPLGEGIAIGLLAFVNEFAWQTVRGARPRGSIAFPALVGEATRHVAYGVATAGIYSVIDRVARQRQFAGDVSLGI